MPTPMPPAPPVMNATLFANRESAKRELVVEVLMACPFSAFL
jgi:hypothetical protein